MQGICEASREALLLLESALEERQDNNAEVQAGQAAVDPCPELPKDAYFEQFELKIVPCTRRYSHDWTACPYAHLGEKAARRDPRVYSYTGIACVSMKQEGKCALGDACPYAHNAFEYWLHPTRYHTEICKQGTKCSRKICFFAHRPSELRRPPIRPGVRPEAAAISALAAAASMGSFLRAAGTGAAAVTMPPPPPRRLPGMDPLAVSPPPPLTAGPVAAGAASAGGLDKLASRVRGGLMHGPSAVDDLAVALLASELLGGPSPECSQLLQPLSPAVLPCASVHGSSSSGGGGGGTSNNQSPTRVLSRLGSTESFLQETTLGRTLGPSPPPASVPLWAHPASNGGPMAATTGSCSGPAGTSISSPSGALDPAVQGVMSLLAQERISVEQAAAALSTMLTPEALAQLQQLLLQA